MRHKKLMKRILLFVLFVFLMSLFTSTFVDALQESDDNSDESTTVSSRQRRVRCPHIKDSLTNGWVKTRNRGRIAKFFCNNQFQLVGNRMSTCIQGKWNIPMPVCASRGCKKIVYSTPYDTTELIKGILLEVKCDPGYSFSGDISSLKVYCNGSDWKLLDSSSDVKSSSDRYVCKQSTESHFITSEEISTISPLKGAVTAKSETTTNSKFNSKMPEMTAMFVSPVINISAMSTESTSLFADNSKTPITEPIDKSYTSTKTTDIIQEVSTLTTTTTIRFNTLQTQIVSTQTTPKMDFTTLSKNFPPKQTNYSTKTPFTDNSTTTVTPTPSTVHSTNSSVSENPLKSTPFLKELTPSPLKSTEAPMTSTSVRQTSTAVQMTSTTGLQNSTAVPLSLTTTTTKMPYKRPIEPFSTSIPISMTRIKTLKMSTFKPEYSKTTARKELNTNLITLSTWSVENSSNSMIKSEINGTTTTTTTRTTTITTTNPLITSISGEGSISKSRVNQTTEPKVMYRSTTTKKILKMTPEVRVTTALSPQIERNSLKTSANKMTTIPIERQLSISTTRQSFSLPSNDSMKYSLFAENTTITPMRRRRQFTTKASLVVTSTASELKENNTRRGLTISLAVISMIILVAILSLYLIKKRTKTLQNSSDDSEMLYLSSDEVFQ